MLSFLDKPLTTKNLYLLVILVSSCIAVAYYFSSFSTYINYNFVYRVETNNSKSTVVENSNWSIRTPIELDSPVWHRISSVKLPPYSHDVTTLSIDGTQQYPEIAEVLLKQQPKPDYKAANLSSEKLKIEDIYNWVHLQLEYSGIQSQPLTISQLLKSKVGDCTEFTLLAYYKLLTQGYREVVAVEGFYFPDNQNRIVSPSNFHAWLLVKINSEWWVLDPLYKEISKPSSEYIVMNLLNEGQSLPLIKNSNLSVKLK